MKAISQNGDNLWTTLHVCFVHRRTAHGAAALPPPPRIFQKAIFRQNNQVIFGQNHLIYMKAMEKNYSGMRLQPPWTKLNPYAYGFVHEICCFSTFSVISKTLWGKPMWQCLPEMASSTPSCGRNTTDNSQFFNYKKLTPFSKIWDGDVEPEICHIAIAKSSNSLVVTTPQNKIITSKSKPTF